MRLQPSMLVLEASFLAGTFGGTEWPPAPFRLLQAMVAGHRSIAVPALEWLERQAPPFILAEDEPPRITFRRAIPNNADTRDPGAATSMRHVLVRRPSRNVYYCYPLRGPADLVAADQVIEAVSKVHTLGTGEDMCAVTGHVMPAAPESLPDVHLWLPPAAEMPTGVVLDASNWLQCPVPGSLVALEERFQAFQGRLAHGRQGFARPVLPPARHREVAYLTSDKAPRTALLPFRLVVPGDPAAMAAFRVEDAVVVGGMLRHAAMRAAAAVAPDLADFAAGHPSEDNKDERLSWIPLPSVGHPHADGQIRRGAWMARAADAALLGRLFQAVGEDGIPLVDEATGEVVALAQVVHAGEEPVFRHYLAPARNWVSVTPMVLPGEHGEGNIRLMTNLFRKAVREAGIDPGLIAAVEFTKQAPMRQGAQIARVKLKDWKAKRLILYHVRVRFVRDLKGPIVLGRGCNFGLGLMCADLQ